MPNPSRDAGKFGEGGDSLEFHPGWNLSLRLKQNLSALLGGGPAMSGVEWAMKKLIFGNGDLSLWVSANGNGSIEQTGSVMECVDGIRLVKEPLDQDRSIKNVDHRA